MGQLCSTDSNGYKKEGRLDAARLCQCRYALYAPDLFAGHAPLFRPVVLCCLPAACLCTSFFVLDIIHVLHVSMST